MGIVPFGLSMYAHSLAYLRLFYKNQSVQPPDICASRDTHHSTRNTRQTTDPQDGRARWMLLITARIRSERSAIQFRMFYNYPSSILLSNGHVAFCKQSVDSTCTRMQRSVPGPLSNIFFKCSVGNIANFRHGDSSCVRSLLNPCLDPPW